MSLWNSLDCDHNLVLLFQIVQFRWMLNEYGPIVYAHGEWASLSPGKWQILSLYYSIECNCGGGSIGEDGNDNVVIVHFNSINC